jgi:hypothetical protein
VEQLHIVRTDLARGYYDTDTRLLHAAFSLLTDHVEIEKAGIQIALSEEGQKYPTKRCGFLGLQTRSAEAGLAHLNWECDLTYQAEEVGEDHPDLGQLTPQAIAARECRALYIWWTQERVARVDPLEASGWREEVARDKEKRCEEPVYTRHDCPNGRVAHALRLCGCYPARHALFRLPRSDARHEAYEKAQAIEDAWRQEDTDQLIRLIRVRTSLWT